MRSNIIAGALGLGIVLLVWGVLALQSWRWHECRKVGHGVAYCLLVEGG